MSIILNSIEKEVIIESHQEPNYILNGILGLPLDCSAIVIFAHGSNSSRLSPRNLSVARTLQAASIGTLLMDLLSEEEVLDRQNVFDIDLLANRLLMAKAWLAENFKTKASKIGYFGASTGAGAALLATAMDPDKVFAIVSRGGRPDLAGQSLKKITTPTLLLVGGNDNIVIELNREALGELAGEKKLSIIPMATHLFEEPGTLEQVAAEATQWFKKHL